MPALLPLKSLRLILPEATSAAHAVVTVRDLHAEHDHWISMGAIDALRVHGVASGGLDFGGAWRARRLRVHIDTDLPRPPRLEVFWHPDVFVFLAQGSGPYRLLVGSYAARRGDYPVDAAIQRLRHNQAPGWQPSLAALGPRMLAAGPSALQAPFDWTRVLLWLVLVAGAVLVAGLATSLLRHSASVSRR